MWAEALPASVGGMAITAPIEARPAPCPTGAGIDPRASATAWILGHGLGRLSCEERRLVAVAVRRRRLDGTPSLVVDEGCQVRIRGSLLEGAARSAGLAWLPLTAADLAPYEGGLFRAEPLQSLSLLLRPPTIWAEEEAAAVERRFPRARRFRPERFDVIERYALRLVGPSQRDAVKRGARRIAEQLPLPDVPAASAVVAAACEAVTRDDACCAAAAARQLARFASSDLAARVAARRRPDSPDLRLLLP